MGTKINFLLIRMKKISGLTMECSRWIRPVTFTEDYRTPIPYVIGLIDELRRITCAYAAAAPGGRLRPNGL